MNNIAKEITDALRNASKKKTSGYDTTAVVTRVEGNTAWVHIPGGVDETPVKLTINAVAGDTVQVRLSGGRGWLTGNVTAPPTDDKQANIATYKADNATFLANMAQKIADTAKGIAGNTAQFFWHTETGSDTGAHITEVPREEFLADPSNGGGNLLARSNGIAIRNGLTELVSIMTSLIRIGISTGFNLQLSTGKLEFYGLNWNDAYKKLGVIKTTDSQYNGLTLTGANAVELGVDNDRSGVNIYDDEGVFITSQDKVYIEGGSGSYMGLNGGVEASNFTVRGHDSAIGTIEDGQTRTNLDLTSGTAKYLSRLVDLPKGTWLAIGFVRFPSNSAGLRRLNISATQDSAAIDVQVNAGSNTMQLEVVQILHPTSSSGTTYHLNAYQDSNSQLTASDIVFKAVRIA